MYEKQARVHSQKWNGAMEKRFVPNIEGNLVNWTGAKDEPFSVRDPRCFAEFGIFPRDIYRMWLLARYAIEKKATYDGTGKKKVASISSGEKMQHLQNLPNIKLLILKTEEDF
mmetsp:Transcript_21330/g.21647  ORF Transcript_21330/g.21647 Transcript_21330/m.21647 type:complete len:113 (-) Transcript_21330:48-386(-)